MANHTSIYTLLLTLTILLFSSCGPTPDKAAEPPQRNASDISQSGGPVTVDGTPKENEGMSATKACHEVKTGEKGLLKSQTFAIDFEPFRNSCFVTSHDPEFKDPPLDSEFAVYKDGKKVFDFPQQFNGNSVGCWVGAVAFQDINGDDKTDVILVGNCAAKMGEFNENTVYLNNGKTFVTNADANYALNDFKTIREIVDFIRKNPSLFSL